jgi:ATP/maltotriose-dependent transcriptional regulator MalT/DNA-binding SARP family transcriptional activator
MTGPLLLTKVSLPHRGKALLTRQRLVELIDEALDLKLILVVAPAGYGKTSLMVDVAHRHEFPFCWYSQDQTDNDLSSFLLHLITCIQQRFSKFGEQSRAALLAFDQGNLSADDCKIAIVNEIYTTITEHFVIVLDDYHLVSENEAINEFVNRFVQDVDQNCHVVILSRALLRLSDLPLMTARAQVTGVGLHDLAFRPQEIQALMLQNYRQALTEDAAQELARQTDGWITGLLLSAQTMWSGMQQHIYMQRASGMQLYDYLANQVFDQQPASLRDFLLRSSFLDEFNPALCQELLGPPTHTSWQSLMQTILAKNLFVIQIERDGFWLRYHQLFRDFLQDRLRVEDPDQVSLLQQSLINIYVRRQEWQKAYAVCLSLGDLEITGNFLERAGEPMTRSGRMALLKSWLEALPPSFLTERPALLARLGVSLAAQGEAPRGLRLLDQAARDYSAQKNYKKLAGVLAWRSLVYNQQARWDASHVDAQEVLRLTEDYPGDEELTIYRAEAYRILGQNQRLLGTLQKSIELLNQALTLFQSQRDSSGVNRIQVSLGATYFETGDFAEAQACYQQALDYFHRHGDLYAEAAVLNDLAVLNHIQGEYHTAFAVFEQSLLTARRGGNFGIETMALVGLGDLFLDLDAPDSALEAYKQARQRLEKSTDHFLNIYRHIAEASAERLQNSYLAAHSLLQAASQLMGSTPSSYTHGLWLLESGQLAFTEQKNERAAKLFSQATLLFEAGGHRILAGRANLFLAGVLFAQGDRESAEQRLQSAFQITADLHSRAVLVAAARYVKPMLTALVFHAPLQQQAQRLLEEVQAFEENLLPLKRSLRFQKMEIPLAPPILKIQALGAARVWLGERPLTQTDWQTQTTRDLLFLILSEPRGWSKEMLGEILWPDSSPAQLKNRFKNAIYRLRRALRQDVIRFDGERYTFNKDLDYSYDVERLEQLFAQSKQRENPGERKLLLEELVQLYQGDYLPEIEGVWVMPEREHLRQVFHTAGLQLAELYISDAQYEQASQICQRLILSDPCLEKAYTLGMQALAATADRPGIIRLYEKLQTNLETQVGIAPSSQTSALFRSLIH